MSTYKGALIIFSSSCSLLGLSQIGQHPGQACLDGGPQRLQLADNRVVARDRLWRGRGQEARELSQGGAAIETRSIDIARARRMVEHMRGIIREHPSFEDLQHHTLLPGNSDLLRQGEAQQCQAEERRGAGATIVAKHAMAKVI